MVQRRGMGSSRGFGMGRIIVALIVAGFAIISYLGTREENPYTGETQYIGISREQEVAMGLQAAPQMAEEYGGLDQDEEAQAYLDQVCQKLITNSVSAETDYPFECSLLADPETINAFALPGGPVFVTAALFNRLQTEGQLAGVMGHEIGHVVARHSAQRIAKQQLTQGLTGAVVIASYDPDNPNSARTAQMAALIGGLVNMSYGREDELESDRLGVRFMADAGYNPNAMVQVMEILAESSEGGGQPEFFSTHPNPENRIAKIQEAIQTEFPDGLPGGLVD